MPLDKPTIILSPQQQTLMREDQEMVEHFKTYRQPFEDQMEMGAKAANMIADPTPRSDTSNIFIGIARMIGEASIAALNEGRPEFGFRPGAASDYKKTVFWGSAIDHILDMSNFDSKQHQFLTDFTYLNMGTYEVVNQYPVRTVQMPTKGGKMEPIVKRDYRREKIEVRHRNPFEVWLDPSSPNLQEVRKVYDEEYLTELEFKRRYTHAVVFNADGTTKPRYENTEHVKPGLSMGFGDQDELMYREIEKKDKIVVGKIQDEENDSVRVYANGVPIMNGMLQMKEMADGRRTAGMNALGVHSFCFGPNEMQYDDNLRTTALYPMGLPFTMRGFDALYQALTNMQVDNVRLSNTVGISYRPFDGTSQIDLDARDFYSGDFIDGEIGVHPFGQPRTGEYQVMMEMLDNWCIYLTGVNFKQLQGETARTAFELSQRIRAQNRRFESKLKVLENGCFRKLGQLTLSGAMSELTVEDYEDITEKEVEKYAKKIKAGEITGEDFELVNGKIGRKKVRTMIRVKDRAFSEKFDSTTNKKRKFDINSTDNTLIENKKLKGLTDSFIPAAPEYLWSQEYIERGGIPDVYAKGMRMLADDKDLKFAKVNALMELARTRAMEDPEGTQFDLQKLEKEYTRVVDLPEEDVMKDEGGVAMDLRKDIEEAEESLFPTIQNALLQSPLESSPAGTAPNPATPESLATREAPSVSNTEQRFATPLQ